MWHVPICTFHYHVNSIGGIGTRIETWQMISKIHEITIQVFVHFKRRRTQQKKKKTKQHECRIHVTMRWSLVTVFQYVCEFKFTVISEISVFGLGNAFEGNKDLPATMVCCSLWQQINRSDGWRIFTLCKFVIFGCSIS